MNHLKPCQLLLMLLMITSLQITSCKNSSDKESINKTENTAKANLDINTNNTADDVLLVKEIASDAQTRTLRFPTSKSIRLQTWAIDRKQEYSVKERLLEMNQQLKSISFDKEKGECTVVFSKETSEIEFDQFFKFVVIDNYKIK